MMKTLLLLLISATSNAGTFDFGGACPSRGEWTRRALEQSAQITAALRQLKDDPNCKGLEGAITNLQTAAVELDQETPSDSESTQGRIESLPGEIDALKGAVIRGGQQNASAVQMLATRNIEAASINSSLQQSSILNSDLGVSSTPKSVNLDRVLKRLRGPVNKGLNLITNVMQEIPKYDECLIGQPSQGLAVIAGAIKVAGAYSSSGEGVADRLGNAVAGLMTMLQQRKFTQVLRAQNQTEFWQSISCLLESTTKNYCDAENAQEILAYSRTQYQAAMKDYEDGRLDANYDNPLEGYYLLVRELPVIANWLQQVTFGVTPKLGTDATFKNQVWEETVEQIKNMNKLYGYFNEQMLYVNSLKDDKQKRNHLVTVIDHIFGTMTGGGGGFAGGTGSKFFTSTVGVQLLPFYLIGRDSIPAPCVATGDNYPMAWDAWMRTNGSGGNFVDDFSNPTALAETIKSRMNEVIEDATIQAGEYFRQRMVVDVTELVDRTLSSQYLTVKKAFESVYSYLSRFETKLRGTDDDLDVMMISSVRETKMRVQRFLDSYRKRHELGMKVKQSNGEDATLNDQLKSASEAVVDSAFTEFNALFQKNVFLTNRLNTFIKRDFAIRIKKSLNMSSHQQDILTISQENLLDTLQQVHGIDPTSAQIDLATAQLVNKRNIDSISAIFTDTMYREMVDFKATINGTGAKGVEEMLKRKNEMMAASLEREYENGDGVYSWNISGFYFMPYVTGVMPNYYKKVTAAHPDLFSASTSTNINARDSKFGDMAVNLAKACIQTLAFENRSFFIELCYGTVLPSYYAQDTIDKKSLDVAYNDYLSRISAPLVKRSAELTSKNICAFNNFKINNLVQYLRDQDKQMYQDVYSTPF